MKRTLMILCLLFLSACEDGTVKKQEAQLINSYIKDINQLLLEHGKFVSQNSDFDALYNEQLKSIQTLDQLQTKYVQNEQFINLISSVEIVDYSLRTLLIRNQQVFELSEPLRQNSVDKLQKLKQEDYFLQHQQTMENLFYLMEEFKTLNKEHNRNIRMKLDATTLSGEIRGRLWPGINMILKNHFASYRPVISQIKLAAELEAEFATFLYNNRDHYVINEQNQLEFDSTQLMHEYNRMVQNADWRRSLRQNTIRFY